MTNSNPTIRDFLTRCGISIPEHATRFHTTGTGDIVFLILTFQNGFQSGAEFHSYPLTGTQYERLKNANLIGSLGYEID